MSKKSKKQEFENFNVFSFIPLIVYSVFVKYLYDLEKRKNCNCSMTQNRNVLKNLVLIYLGVQLFLIITVFLLPPVNHTALLIVFSIVNIILFTAMSIYFYNYEIELINNNCGCSKDNRKMFFKYYLLFIYSLLIIQLTFLTYYSIFVIKENKTLSVIELN
jgi:uncharacterized protein YacL